MEIWKKIPDFNPIYEASNLGNIRRLEAVYTRTMHGKPLTQKLPYRLLSLATITHKGYIQVRFNGRIYMAHRVIGLAFIPNPKNLPQINHKNGIKTDNRAENLEWCTNQENRDHMVANKRHAYGSKSGVAKLTEEDIPKIRELLNSGMSRAKVGKIFNVSAGAIQPIHEGKHWKHVP